MAAEPEAEDRIRAACDAKAFDRAATIALETYGDELMSYLVALLRNATDADDVFAAVTESLWKNLPRFRWDSSLRTYAYTIARRTFLKHLRDPQRGRREALSTESFQAIAARPRTRTATYLRTETKDKIAELRAQLDPEDQTLLILRVNRQLPWRDVARIMRDDDDDDDDGDDGEADLDRRAAALRKRFERLKDELREKAKLT
ncbi:MAG: RNA polymerase sigma factor [Deltaproteobacteria bacterium]|nr:RNA polymerase sigma factor [Deltaproteobacteria bacterium]